MALSFWWELGLSFCVTGIWGSAADILAEATAQDGTVHVAVQNPDPD